MPLLLVGDKKAGVLELVFAQLAIVAPQVFCVPGSRVIVQNVLRHKTFRAYVTFELAFKG